jgi:lipopolysaccharide export system protein LptA
VKLGLVLAIGALAAWPALAWAQTPARPAAGANAPAPSKSADGKSGNGKAATNGKSTTSGKAAETKTGDGKNGEGSKKQPVVIDADRMERFGKEGLIIFTGSVVARHDNSVQYADRMEVYLDEKGDKVVRSVSTGNIRIITKDCKTGTAKRADYFDLEQRLILIGDARVWQDDNVVTGETITIDLAQDRNVVNAGKQDRVKAVFYQKGDNTNKPAGGQPACAN